MKSISPRTRLPGLWTCIAVRLSVLAASFILISPAYAGLRGKKGQSQESEIDRIIREAQAQPSQPGNEASPGSLYAAGNRFSDLYRELRAVQVNDLVTIVVADRASAVQTGTSNVQRKSSANASVGPLFGKQAKVLTDLAGLSGDQQLQGQGTTSRESSISTTLTARVSHVLPNGNIVIEARKKIAVNSEEQTIIVRGLARTFDLTTNNMVRSDRLANLEVWVTGKGLVTDAVRRPNILYRILLGVLPF